MAKKISLSIFVSVFLLMGFSGLRAEEGINADQDLLTAFTFRNLGPSRQGGRIVDFAVPVSQPYTFYAASASGGLWKTINNGVTFTPVFDHQSVISIGDVAVAPANPDIVWVGTGEAANSRSAYWGDGVYKSTDGGKTWTNMGLKDSHHVGRIVIHPQDPDIVYVAAMGHLFSENEERGLFKTADGGANWTKVLSINNHVGVIDVALDTEAPEILYAAAYEKKRLPWTFEEAGPESAIYKSTDGGLHWVKLGGGLPSGKIGRIGLDIFAGDTRIVYATMENSNPRPAAETTAKKSTSRRSQQPQVIGGEIYRSENKGVTWTKMNADKDNIGGSPGYYYGQIRIDPQDDQTIYVLSINLSRSRDGGRTWGQGSERNAAPMTHSDHHALWIDPQNSDHMLLGNDGGVYSTYDRGLTWDHYQNLPLAQYYAIGVDMESPYNIYGGLQDNGSWKGPSFSRSGQITRDHWVSTGGGDGMYNQVDPEDSRWLYNESQFGPLQRVDQKTGDVTSIKPQRERGQPALRFNWNAPIHLSPHNSRILYMGANVLFRSMNRGDDWQEISPDLTLNDPVKTAGKGNIQYCTIVTISESPVTPGIIWAGTDDGKLHITRNGGGAWNELTSNLVGAGAPEAYWVSRIFASPHDAGTAFVSKTGYRRDDFRPFVFKTTDYGQSWQALANNLPEEPINVVVQDRKNPDLLFVGTDMGLFISLNAGREWQRLRNNLPTTPVHDLLIHPRENDLILGTHGRGIFVTDISPLQELDEELLAKNVHLFAVKSQVRRNTTRSMFDAFSGHRNFSAPNPPSGLVIYYYLKENAAQMPKIVISDPYGKQIRSLSGVKEKGLHSVVWNMRVPRSQTQPQETSAESEYLVTLELGDQRLTQKARVFQER
jgi:photosystem II stability/assembly factor-like uncharacterized protein